MQRGILFLAETERVGEGEIERERIRGSGKSDPKKLLPDWLHIHMDCLLPCASCMLMLVL